MFALSTNHSNPQKRIAMNQFFSSAFAAMLTLSAIGAQAGTNIITSDNLVQLTEVQSTQDLAVSASVTMRIKAQLPDGTITTKKGRYDSMSKALVAYHQFIATLPHGSRILAVDFTDEGGGLIFSAQG